MSEGLVLAMLALGLVSGVHCVAMCGGIVGAFSLQRVIPIRPERPRAPLARLAAFNAGRISTYAAMGAAAGALGAGVGFALEAQVALYILVNVALVLAGLYLAGMDAGLSRLESLGAPLWRRLQPLAAKLLPGRNAYFAGLVWGFLPCGLVYAALAAAAFAGTPALGAAAMLAFGIGTLPFLLAAGFAATRLRAWLRLRAARIAAGSAVLAFGAYGLAHAGGVADGIRGGILCF